jgi:hypothetical protein
MPLAVPPGESTSKMMALTLSSRTKASKRAAKSSTATPPPVEAFSTMLARCEIMPTSGITATSPSLRATPAARRPSIRVWISSSVSKPPWALKTRKSAIACSFSGCMTQASAAKAEMMWR